MEKGEKREKVIEYLRRAIQSGRWPDMRLPREIDLAAELGVARGTLRKALSRLEAEGLLIRKKHSGTMISSEEPKPVIGAVMRCRSDFYEDVYRHLLRELDKARESAKKSAARTMPDSWDWFFRNTRTITPTTSSLHYL